jgi:hypothetical protein
VIKKFMGKQKNTCMKFHQACKFEIVSENGNYQNCAHFDSMYYVFVAQHIIHREKLHYCCAWVHKLEIIAINHFCFLGRGRG